LGFFCYAQRTLFLKGSYYKHFTVVVLKETIKQIT